MAFDYVNYYRLEYLQTVGTQRIDTGIKGYCEFELDFQLTSPGTAGYNSFFGSRQDGATNRFGCFNYNGIFHFMTGTGNTWNIAVDTNRHLIHFNSSLFTDNGTEYAVSLPGGSYGSSNFYLMWMNGGSGGSNGYWYYAKFWDSNGTLIRDYIPAQRKSDNVLGMYDAVNDTFTVNSGSGSFTAGSIIGVVDASVDPANSGTVSGTGEYTNGSSVTITATPNSGYEFENWTLNGYTKLEYIESSGTQYIDTGLTIGATFREECDCMILDTSGEKRQGCWNAGQSWGCSNGYMYVFGATASSRPVGSRYLVNVKYDTSNTTLTIDGQAMTTSSRTVTTTQKYLLFASSYTDGSPAGGTHLSMRMYEDKLGDSSTGGNLVRHFIPVMRNSDSKIGLLDLVEMKFYANAGTSEFNKFKESDTVTTPAFSGSWSGWASGVSDYGADVNNNYITIDFQKPVVVVEYEGNNHNDNYSIAGSFTIAGSDDNVTYTDIQTDAGPAKAFQTVTVHNSTAYRYYRLIYSAYNNSYSSRRYVFANLSFSGYTEEEASSVILYDNPITVTLKDNLDLIANFEKAANCRYKVNGEGKQAMMYIKVSGQGVQGTPKIKVNGVGKDSL